MLKKWDVRELGFIWGKIETRGGLDKTLGALLSI
jgi:hypothetical protein